MKQLISIVVLFHALFQPLQALSKDQLLVIALSTNRTDTYERLVRSLNIYRYRYETYGFGQEWNDDQGKVQILRDRLARFQDDPDQIVLFIDNPNVIFTQGAEFVLDKFHSLKPARIVVSADDFCWPDESLQVDYPLVESNEKRFLNSALIMAYASDLYRLMSSEETISNLQIFMTKTFLNEKLRNERSIVLDKRADIFLNLDGAIDEVELPVLNDEVYVKNSWTDSVPTVIHGNGPSKKSLNYLSNYVARTWSTNEGEARQQAISECQQDRCDFLFVVDSIVHLDHPDTLIHLIRYNRTIVAPMLLRPGQAWSNFWGDFNEQGFYQRSPDYLDLVNYKKMGLFNVPHIAHSYLINGTFLQHFTPNYIDKQIDPDVKFCQSVRQSGYFMFITNELNFGHLIDPENFNISLIQPELYEIFNNVKDWKARYLHPDYHKSLEPNATIAQPCPDVYWFPMVSHEFTESLINLMETFNQWSGSAHNDARLAGGYENVPTDDIHMTQVNFQEHWLFILRDIVQPIQQKVFTGYFSDPPRAILNFVVRYMPERQNKLRAHHDASTYTMNLALNDAGKDFEGGGCRFVRQNCSILQTRRGWALLQPGRLTHLHEGLPVTKGKRYIMVSFIDP